MSDFTNIRMEKKWSLFVAGHIGPWQTGWVFYPITFKGAKYVVEFRGYVFGRRPEDLKVYAQCYEYGEEKKLFRGYKRKFVFEEDISFITIGENLDNSYTALDIRETTKDELKIYLPRIMAEIFRAWESRKEAESEQKKKVAEAVFWSGVVDPDNSLKGLSLYGGKTEEEILKVTRSLLAEINKYDEPIWSIPDFLLLADGINGLLRVGTKYVPSKELQRKYINTLCSLAQDIIEERTTNRDPED